jgi:hypothetical protein
MITPENRAEFEEAGPDNVRLRITRSIYSSEKQKQAYEWLDEKEHGADRAIAASVRDAAWAAVRRSTIAIWISVAAALIALAGLILPHFWKLPS